MAAKGGGNAQQHGDGADGPLTTPIPASVAGVKLALAARKSDAAAISRPTRAGRTSKTTPEESVRGDAAIERCGNSSWTSTQPASTLLSGEKRMGLR